MSRSKGCRIDTGMDYEHKQIIKDYLLDTLSGLRDRAKDLRGLHQSKADGMRLVAAARCEECGDFVEGYLLPWVETHDDWTCFDTNDPREILAEFWLRQYTEMHDFRVWLETTYGGRWDKGQRRQRNRTDCLLNFVEQAVKALG